MSKRGRPRHPDVLTPREWEVLSFIREGLSNQEIANRLDISVDGVKFHVSEILGKLGVRNRREAARWSALGGEEARPWWLAAGAPLLFWRRLPLGWLSPALAGGLAVVVATGIGLLIWTLLATRADEPTTSAPVPVALPAGDRLAYIGADRNLWVLEGGGPGRRLTEIALPIGEGGNVPTLPQWSPDGRQLLFFQEGDLWLADTVTEEMRRLVAAPGDHFGFLRVPRWSPDSRQVAYVVPGTSNLTSGALWVSDLGGDAHELVPDDFGVWDIAWSPDGHQLAVAHSQPVVYPQDWNEPGAAVQIAQDNGIYLIDADGGEPEPLVLVGAIQDAWDEGLGLPPSQGSPDATGVTGVDSAQWSPDGRYIAFQPMTLSASLMADGVPIFTVGVEGGPPAYHGVMLRSWALLAWFPDSHRFIFTLGGGRDVYWGKTIAIAQAGVSGATVIAEDPERLPTPENAAGTSPSLSIRSDAWPVISPDGKRIAFQASETSWQTQRLDVGKVEGPREGIWVVDADVASPRQLTSDPDYLDFYPRWSADGELIMFVRTDGQPFAGEAAGQGSPRAALWLMRSDGSEAKPLLTHLLRTGSYYGLFRWDDFVAWYRAPNE